MFDIQFYVIVVPLLLIVLTIHEYAHAKAADMLGDPTPRLAGRLTLNPLSHIDPIGFLVLIVTRLIGWAKPVPINPYNFANPKRDSVIVSLAGPVSNFFFAWVLAVFLRHIPAGKEEIWIILPQIMQQAIWFNIVLAVFNLIPIPPLDGSHLLETFLPYEYGNVLFWLKQYGFLILIFIVFFPPAQNLLFFIIQSLFNFLV